MLEKDHGTIEGGEENHVASPLNAKELLALARYKRTYASWVGSELSYEDAARAAFTRWRLNPRDRLKNRVFKRVDHINC